MFTYFGCLMMIYIILIIGGIVCIIVERRRMIKNKKRMEFYARRVARRLKWNEEHEGSI